MAINSDIKSHTPEELPADNGLAEAPRNEEPGSGEKSKAVISVSGDVDTNPAVLDPEDGGAEASRTSKSTSRSWKSFDMPRPSRQFRHAGTINSPSTRSPSGSLAPSPSPL